MRRLGRIGTLLAALAMLPIPAVLAETPLPYDSYQYNAAGQAVGAPAGYQPTETVTGEELGIGAFGKITDLVKGADGRLYLADGDAGALHILTSDLSFVNTLSFTENGKPAALSGMQGIWLDTRGGKTRYYLTDPEHKRIAVADEEGQIVSSLLPPPVEVMPEGSDFKPYRVLVDGAGTVYVLLQNFYRGALVYGADGEFQTFFGANRVELTPRLLLDYVWKKLLNDTQKEAMSRYVPVSFAAFDMDPEGFLYTVTEKTVAGESTLGSDQLKKYNAKGINVLPSKTYGDLEIAYRNQKVIQTALVDVDVTQEGCIAALDATQGRVFLYNRDGELLTVFGGRGGFIGNTRVPSSIETIGRNVYVADQMSNSLTRYTPTAYGETLLEASAAYRHGDYASSMDLWETLRKHNGADATALRGLGKASLSAGDYDKAMRYFELVGDKDGYSAAFEQQRGISLRIWFIPVFLILLLLIGWMVVTDIRKKNYIKPDVDATRISLGRKVWYTVRHPTEGYHALASRQSVRSLALTSAGCLAAWFVVSVLAWEKTGFLFNSHAAEPFSIWPILGQTWLVFALFVLSAWFVSTMADGSARLIDIVMVTAVGLLPFMTGLLVRTVLSNWLAQSEGMYLSLFMFLMGLWSAVIIFAGFKALMEYSFWKNLLILLYTFVGLLIILFLALLLWSLFQQMMMFAVSLCEEISVLIKGGGV